MRACVADILRGAANHCCNRFCIVLPGLFAWVLAEKRALRLVVRTAIGTDRKHPEYLAVPIHSREAGASTCNKYGICTPVVYGDRGDCGPEDGPRHSKVTRR